MQPLHSGIIFLPRSSKTWTWKQSPLLPPKITENHKNVCKLGPRRLPKSTLKSIKLDLRNLCVLKCLLLDPRITKMVSRVPKMEPQGLQNDSFGYQK